MPTSSVKRLLKAPSDEQPTAKQASVTLRSPRRSSAIAGGYNRIHDRCPAAVVRPADGDDIARALEFTTCANLEVAVRSGGHSLAGYGTTEGGVLIDLSAMHAIYIDPAPRTAWVEAGTIAGQLTAATAAHGLIVPFGDSPDVGVGGITLGGGSAG
jgi:FAD/FMN-containing dehydrogenase